MELFPALHLGWLNGWIFLPFIYFSSDGFAQSLPKEISARLFDRQGWTRRDEIRGLMANIPTLAYFALLIFSPLKINSWLMPIGTTVFVLGAGACAHSIWMFTKTPIKEPVTRGLYRISRNPQMVGLFIAVIGVSITIGSWIALGVVLVWGVFLHLKVLAEEKICLVKYGEAYRQFMARVPRYLDWHLCIYMKRGFNHGRKTGETANRNSLEV